jgi:hypothetical protein
MNLERVSFQKSGSFAVAVEVGQKHLRRVTNGGLIEVDVEH